MRRDVLIADLVIAAVFAGVVVIVAPGWAVVAIFAAVLLVACVASVLVGRLRRPRPPRSRPRYPRRN